MNNSVRASTGSLDDISMLKRIKQHLANCDCCREAVAQGSNDNE